MGVEEEDVWVAGEVVVAELSGCFCRVVDLEVVVWVLGRVLLFQEAQAMMNMVREKTAAIMVQQQSVHFLSFSSTGKFRKL